MVIYDWWPYRTRIVSRNRKQNEKFIPKSGHGSRWLKFKDDEKIEIIERKKIYNISEGLSSFVGSLCYCVSIIWNVEMEAFTCIVLRQRWFDYYFSYHCLNMEKNSSHNMIFIVRRRRANLQRNEEPLRTTQNRTVFFLFH